MILTCKRDEKNKYSSNGGHSGICGDRLYMAPCLWSCRNRRTSIYGKRIHCSQIRPPAVSGFRVFPYAESCLLICAVLLHSVLLPAGKIILRHLRNWDLVDDLPHCARSFCRSGQTEQPHSSSIQRRFTYPLSTVSECSIPRVESYTLYLFRCPSLPSSLPSYPE